MVLHLGPKMHPTNMMQAMSNHPKIVSKPADKIKSTNFSDTPQEVQGVCCRKKTEQGETGNNLPISEGGQSR